jgi:hypothetical protein
VYNGIQGDALDWREEIYMVDHRDHILSSIGHISDDLPTIVHEDMRLVLNPCEYSPWMVMNECLVKSLGLTKAYDTSQSYK